MEAQGKRFSELGIVSSASTSFVGTKMLMDDVLNVEIRITRWKIEPSTAKIGSLRLCLEFMIGTAKHIVFTGSGILMEDIKKVPENAYPLTTTIKKENKRFVFT